MRIIRRGSGSVVTWRRAQMVLLSAQGMAAPAIAKSRHQRGPGADVIRDLDVDGFSSLYPKYKGGRPPKFTLPQRREIKKITKAGPGDYDLPFSTWSLAKLEDFLVAEGVVDDIGHEGLRILSARRASFSTAENLEGLHGPAVRGEEGPHRAPVCDRRPRDHPGGRRPGGSVLRGSMPMSSAAEPAAPARPAVGRHQRERQRARQVAAAPDARHLHPHRRGPAPAGRL